MHNFLSLPGGFVYPLTNRRAHFYIYPRYHLEHDTLVLKIIAPLEDVNEHNFILGYHL